MIDSGFFLYPLFKHNLEQRIWISPSRKSEWHWPLINTERVTATGHFHISFYWKHFQNQNSIVWS